jgi:hypothetical protein
VLRDHTWIAPETSSDANAPLPGPRKASLCTAALWPAYCTLVSASASSHTRTTEGAWEPPPSRAPPRPAVGDEVESWGKRVSISYVVLALVIRCRAHRQYADLRASAGTRTRAGAEVSTVWPAYCTLICASASSNHRTAEEAWEPPPHGHHRDL